MPERDFLAYWGFDDDEYDDIAQDRSSWFRDAEISGAIRNDSGVNDKAMTFNGSDHHMRTETAGFSTTAGTFETWLHLDPMNGSQEEAIFSAPAELPDNDEGLVGHWRMNEYGWSNRFYEVKDASIGKNDGRGRDGATTHYWGRYGRSGTFNGASAYVSGGKEPSLRPTDHIAVECWVNIQSMSDWESIVSYAYDTSDRESGYDLYFHSGQVRFRVATGSSGFTNSPGFSPQTNTWYHMVGVYDGSKVRLYIDGVEQGSGTAASGGIDWTHTSANELYIGRFHDNNENHHYQGKIDEVLIYNRPLSGEEINDHFHFGLSLVRHQDDRLSFRIGNSTLEADIAGLTDWHHVACTWNSSGSLELYLDGLRVANASAFWIGEAFAYYSYLGNDERGTMGLHGSMDAVVLYSRNLTTEEIMASYGSNGAVKEIIFNIGGTGETDEKSDKPGHAILLLLALLFISGVVLIWWIIRGGHLAAFDISKIPIGEVLHIEETALSVDEYRHRSTVPSKAFHNLELNEGDSLRWVTLKNGLVLVTKKDLIEASQAEDKAGDHAADENGTKD